VDGFVDDRAISLFSGRTSKVRIGGCKALTGPFTQAERKLAHYVERELQRWMTARGTPVALPVEEPASKSAERKARCAGGIARPLADR
jgi:hypothetical protein